MSIIERDLRHVWHPCSQMKDYESFKPLNVIKAKGCHIELENGKKIIDSFSSWWCKSLGHNHPRLKGAIMQQIEKFEHVALVNTTNETIAALSEKLSQLMPSLSKVFYASDGSCAIEIAMKMSLHARKIQGDNKRNFYISLENSYHGETIGALSVSDVGLYRDPYKPILFATHFIAPLPYVTGREEPLWHDCQAAWEAIEKSLEPFCETATAVLVEPIIQGAGGMKVYSQDFLRHLRRWTRKNNIHLIADEIMTGIGRTGKMLGCEYADIEPDMLCLGKGLTSGWLPMSVVLTSQPMYDIFYDDYQTGKSFLHSHTHSGNALAASIALEVINIIQEEKICARANQLGIIMREYMQDIADKTEKLKNVRGIGAMIAADLVHHEPDRRISFEIYRKAVELGAMLRPLGDTLYWLPPLNIEMDTLTQLKHITEEAIRAVPF
jgi:adenosylmethionine---8-amino-7-oxononanoate aminotransferase